MRLYALVFPGYSVDEVRVFFHRLLVSMRRRCSQEVTDIVTTDRRTREQQANAIGLPLWSTFGAKISKRPQEELGWKVDHMRVFASVQLTWPVNFSAPAAAEIDLSGLLLREQEALYFYHVVWAPVDGNPDFEYVDVNQNIRRILGGHLVIDEDGVATLSGTTVWRPKPPTLTGSSKIAVRYRYNGVPHVRLLEPMELFRIQGSPACRVPPSSVARPPAPSPYLQVVGRVGG